MKPTSYIVYRHGANRANQSLTEAMPVAIVQAANREAAEQTVRERETVYANQFLRAVPASRCSAADWNAAAGYEAEAK